MSDKNMLFLEFIWVQTLSLAIKMKKEITIRKYKQTNIHTWYTPYELTSRKTHIHIDTTHTSVYYLAIITHHTHTKNCAKYSPTYRLDQLCIRRLFDKKEYYYDYCYILLSTTPFPTKIHKKTAQLSKFYPISKKNRSVFSPLIKTILRGEKN